MLKTSPSQFECMVQYMLRNGDLNRYVVNDPPARLVVKKKWEELTSSLNLDATGTSKSVEKWRKVWADLKNYVKKKALRINLKNTDGTGVPAKVTLSQLEENVLKIMGRKSHRVITLKQTNPGGSLKGGHSGDPLQSNLERDLLYRDHAKVEILGESVESNGLAKSVTPGQCEEHQNDTDHNVTIEHDTIQHREVEIEIINTSNNEIKRLNHTQEESPEFLNEMETSVITETNKLFAKIIEQELVLVPKRRRIECMQEMLGVIKKHNK